MRAEDTTKQSLRKSVVHCERVLPTNLAAERSILGAVIEDDDAILPEVITAGLRVEDFSISDHRRVYAAMLELWQDKKPIDMVLLTERLGNQIEDAVAVASLIEGGIVHPDHIVHRVQVVRDKARLRGLPQVAEWINKAVDETADPDARIEQAIARLEAIAREEVKA